MSEMSRPAVWEKRKSVRKYSSKEVSNDAVNRILSAAIKAPSAGNIQPWHFFVITDLNAKDQLCSAALNQGFVKEAPIVIVVCAKPQESAKKYKDRGINLFCIQDTAAAIQNMLLAAVSEGLGSCWVGAFDEDEAARIIDVDKETTRPVALITLGYPEKEPSKRPRHPLDEVVTWQ